jgi:hypothetical protein
MQPTRSDAGVRLPLVPQRSTPSFAFSELVRALNDCLAPRQFGQAEMQRTLQFFKMSEPECVYCGSREVHRWDHVVAISQGGETVLGNMVPACARCDDSKRDVPYEAWMSSSAAGSPKSRGVGDIAERISRIQACARHFDYTVCPLEQRLSEQENERLAQIRSRLAELRQEIDALIRDYRERTGNM